MDIHSYFSAANLFRMEIQNNEYRIILSEIIIPIKMPNNLERGYHLVIYATKHNEPFYTNTSKNISQLMQQIYYTLFNDNQASLKVE